MLVWLVARSRARVGVLVLAGGVCMDVCNKLRYVPCGVVVYICIYLYNALVACVGGVFLARIWIDIYNGGLLVFCACVYLSDDKTHPKFKQFSRINTVYMQKSAENRIFCMDI